MTNWLQLLQNAQSQADYEEVKTRLNEGGYASFSDLLEQLKSQLKSCDETNLDDVKQALTNAKQAFPLPEQFSPAWQNIWNELDKMLSYKRSALKQVPLAEQRGRMADSYG